MHAHYRQHTCWWLSFKQCFIGSGWHFVVCRGLQYCAKVTQAKCANFVLCSCKLSRKVPMKVRVTIWGLLGEISLEQRMLFHRNFGTIQNFMMTSVVSLAQCPKFCVRQTTIPYRIYLIYLSCNAGETHRRFSTQPLTGVQSWKERMRIKSKTYHKWRIWI